MKKRRVFCVLSMLALFSLNYSSLLNYDLETDNNIEKRLQLISKNKNIEKLIKEEIFNLTNSQYYSIEYLTYARDFNGNIFAVAKFFPKGFAILNLSIGEFMEISTNSDFPYEIDQVKSKYYVPLYGFYNEDGSSSLTNTSNAISSSDNKDSTSLSNLKKISNQLSINYPKFRNRTNLEKIQGKIQINDYYYDDMPQETPSMTVFSGVDAPKAEIEIPYSWFFRLNKTQFPENIDGNCGYVVMSMLLWYADMFESAGYLSAYDYENFITVGNGEYGKCVPTLSEDFIDHYRPNSGSLVPVDAGDLIDEFMVGKEIDYDCKTTIWVFTKGIDDILAEGIPVGYFGNLPVEPNNNKGFHAITVYGSYGNGKILAHYGWDGYNQVIISKASMFELGGYVYIENYETHHHRKYISNGKHSYCGCGLLMEC